MTKTLKADLTQIHTLGAKMHELTRKLFPICRSISGEGFRQSLQILDEAMGGGIRKNPLR